MRKYNINASSIRVTENLYDKIQSAVLFNAVHKTGSELQSKSDRVSTVTNLFNIVLESIMCETLADHEGSAYSQIPLCR